MSTQYISTGCMHTCKINKIIPGTSVVPSIDLWPIPNVSNKLSCWGSDQDGESRVPSSMKQDMFMVAAGVRHTCAISVTGRLACWGSDA